MTPVATLDINPSEFSVFLAVFLRLSLILFMLPIFSSSQVPANIKVCVVLALTLMLFPFVRQNIQPVALLPGTVCYIVVGELVFGIIFSLSMLLVVGAAQFAGELISFEMGFGFAQVADPQTGAEFTILGIWAQLLAMMIFFSLNGHHIVLKLIVESFRTVPVGSFTLDSALFGKMIVLSGLLFALALKLAAPLIAVLVLTQIGFGLMSKFAPQINILATSFPMTIAIGILFMSFVVGVWGDIAGGAFTRLFHFLGNLSR